MDTFRYAIINSTATLEERMTLLSLWDGGALGFPSPGQDDFATVAERLVTSLRTSRAGLGDISTKTHGRIHINS
jgi:hypothetical protein